MGKTTVPAWWMKVRPGMGLHFWYRVGREATRLGVRRDKAKMIELIRSMR